MKAVGVSFFEFSQAETTIHVEEPDATLIRHLDMFSSIVTASCYIVDLRTRQFCYIQPNDLFLCGYSVEEALAPGYDFYQKIVYTEDLRLWASIHKAILLYIKENKDKWDEIDYFSCAFRLQRTYSFLTRPLPQMVYHLIKPVWEGDELCYLICAVDNSTTEKAGNLRVYYKDELTYKAYSTISRHWDRKCIEPLTERERAILMLARQGKSIKEIADVLCTSFHTINNQIAELFFRLDVHSMQEAIDFALAHNIMYDPPKDSPELESLPTEAPRKRTRILISDDMMHRIRAYLSDGLSIRETAAKIGVSASAM